MADKLSSLPIELLSQIVHLFIALDNDNEEEFEHCERLMNWSSTSCFFRSFLAPFIFRSVELRNKDKSGASLRSLARGNHASLIQKIYFIGFAYADPNDELEALSETTNVLPESVATVLSNLRDFPNLEVLSVEFNYYMSLMHVGFSAKEELEVQVEAAEKREPWRALMAKTYDALTKNKGYTKGLELRDLIYKRTSTFSNPRFHDFLSHLKTFSLSLCEDNHSPEREINENNEYGAFTSRLDDFFFDHLVNVTSLTIHATETGPLGETGPEGWGQVPLALKQNQMPFLQSVCLTYIIIGPTLTDFLVDHQATLRSLSLNNCFINMIRSKADKNFYWEHFFTALYNANFANLHQIEILPFNLPLNLDESSDDGLEESELLSEEIRQVRKLSHYPPSNRRLFVYAALDDILGELWPHEEENLAAFKRGRDQATYDRLMRKIKLVSKVRAT